MFKLSLKANSFKINLAPFSNFWFSFHYSERWIPKALDGIEVIVCPTYSFLNNFIVSILTLRPLSYLKFIFVYGLRNVLTSFSFSLLKEPPHCPPCCFHLFSFPAMEEEGSVFSTGSSGFNLCSCSVTQLCPTLCDPWTAAHQASRSFTVSLRLLKLMSIESVMPSNHLILCCPLLLLPSIFSSIRVFSNESVLLIRWPNYWSFSLSPSSEYSALICFRIDWFDPLTVQGTLKSLLQHHNLKVSILALSLHYGPTLISVYDYWKNHSFDYMDLCWQSHVSAF